MLCARTNACTGICKSFLFPSSQRFWMSILSIYQSINNQHQVVSSRHCPENVSAHTLRWRPPMMFINMSWWEDEKKHIWRIIKLILVSVVSCIFSKRYRQCISWVLVGNDCALPFLWINEKMCWVEWKLSLTCVFVCICMIGWLELVCRAGPSLLISEMELLRIAVLFLIVQ